MDAKEALKKLVDGNKRSVPALTPEGDVSQVRRTETSTNGQHPYAVVCTCSDSRVVPEHIFSAGTGDLFVVRTAGNVLGPIDRGSVEYAVEHLGIKLVVVMGHTSCGAVKAALSDDTVEGDLGVIVDEIRHAIHETSDASVAEDLNIMNTLRSLAENPLIHDYCEHHGVMVVGAKYSIQDGTVTFL